MNIYYLFAESYKEARPKLVYINEVFYGTLLLRL